MNSYRELCYVRGCNEKEYQELRNEILKNVNVDVENISLNEFFKYMFDFTLEQMNKRRTVNEPLFMRVFKHCSSMFHEQKPFYKKLKIKVKNNII